MGCITCSSNWKKIALHHILASLSGQVLSLLCIAIVFRNPSQWIRRPWLHRLSALPKQTLIWQWDFLCQSVSRMATEKPDQELLSLEVLFVDFDLPLEFWSFQWYAGTGSKLIQRYSSLLWTKQQRWMNRSLWDKMSYLCRPKLPSTLPLFSSIQWMSEIS